jgi:hypothetical protein
MGRPTIEVSVRTLSRQLRVARERRWSPPRGRLIGGRDQFDQGAENAIERCRGFRVIGPAQQVCANAGQSGNDVEVTDIHPSALRGEGVSECDRLRKEDFVDRRKEADVALTASRKMPCGEPKSSEPVEKSRGELTALLSVEGGDLQIVVAHSVPALTLEARIQVPAAERDAEISLGQR